MTVLVFSVHCQTSLWTLHYDFIYQANMLYEKQQSMQTLCTPLLWPSVSEACLKKVVMNIYCVNKKRSTSETLIDVTLRAIEENCDKLFYSYCETFLVWRIDGERAVRCPKTQSEHVISPDYLNPSSCSVHRLSVCLLKQRSQMKRT